MAIWYEKLPLSELHWLCFMACATTRRQCQGYLKRGSDLRSVQRFHLLLIAAGHGYLDVVRVLIDAGADVNAFVAKRGQTALMRTAY